MRCHDFNQDNDENNGVRENQSKRESFYGALSSHVLSTQVSQTCPRKRDRNLFSAGPLDFVLNCRFVLPAPNMQSGTGQPPFRVTKGIEAWRSEDASTPGGPTKVFYCSITKMPNYRVRAHANQTQPDPRMKALILTIPTPTLVLSPNLDPARPSRLRSFGTRTPSRPTRAPPPRPVALAP